MAAPAPDPWGRYFRSLIFTPPREDLSSTIRATWPQVFGQLLPPECLIDFGWRGRAEFVGGVATDVVQALQRWDRCGRVGECPIDFKHLYFGPPWPAAGNDVY